jgi:hypothetical protein
MPAIKAHFCTACGHQLAADARFCPACGAASQVRRAIPSESQAGAPAPRVGVAIALAASGLLGLIVIVLIMVANRPNPEPINPTPNPLPPKAGVSTNLPPSPPPTPTTPPTPSTPSPPPTPTTPTTPPTPPPDQGQAAGAIIPPASTTATPSSHLPPPSSTGGNPRPPAGKPGQGSQQQITSERFGFSFELPKHWEHHLENDTLFLSPPDDSPESKEIWGDLQVISKRPGGTLKQQFENLKEQIKGFKNPVIGLEKSTDFAGHPATYLLIRYSQEAVEADYMGIWVIAERGPYFYWLSFHILQEHFDQHSPIVENALETFQFSPINQPK